MTATMDHAANTVPQQQKPPARSRKRPAPAGPPGAAESTAAVLSSAFTMIAIVCLWAAVQLLFLSSISQSRAQDLLYNEFRGDLAGATAPVGPIVSPGDPVALLTIPGIGLEQVVVEGTASGDLMSGPGHRRDTPLPGQVGTSVVYGRATTYGGPFGDLTQLRAGDKIEVDVGQGRRVFRVSGVRRAGDPLPQPPADGAARLTLVTAEGSGRLDALAPESVVYVDADAKKGYPAPAGRAPAVPESEQSMARDTSALPLLALCLALLLALTLGVVAARQRWSAALVWVVATPLVIALSWATTDVVMRLMPNLI
jgi:sortase A